MCVCVYVRVCVFVVFVVVEINFCKSSFAGGGAGGPNQLFFYDGMNYCLEAHTLSKSLTPNSPCVCLVLSKKNFWNSSFAGGGGHDRQRQ